MRNTGYIHVETLLKEKKNKRKKEDEHAAQHGCHGTGLKVEGTL